MSEHTNSRDIILQLLREKSSLKQDVFYTTIDLFNQLREVVRSVASELKPLAEAIDKRIVVEFRERNAYEIELRVAGDVLLFHMHTNVFEFDTSHHIWKTGYVKENPGRSRIGITLSRRQLAEAVGFEPTVRFPARWFSRPEP